MFPKTTSILALALGILNFHSTQVAADVTSALVPIELSREGWKITADSQHPGNEATLTLDDNPKTFWHSEYNVALPHSIIVDMGNQYAVNGFSYLPRQDGNINGNIATHSIDCSLDGNTWQTQAQGTWANDQTVKTTLWTPVICRYVRLLATSEASGQQFSSAAEINILTNPHSAVPRAAWNVTADSEETTVQSYAAINAIDGSPATYWHSQWRNLQAPLPHTFTINQGSPSLIGGLSYVPRPPNDGVNGRIGQYQVQYSTNGATWTLIASGTWADTGTIKHVEWNPISAQYWRLIALTEAGNRGPWTSASEINLLDGAVSLANFIVTVDSQETIDKNCSAVNAFDSDTTSLWHTQYTGGSPSYPHTFSIDMQATLPVKALQYTPRQDGNFNGNIGQFRIEVSLDAKSWSTVATGQYADSSVIKLTQFQETLCRYVRLVALSEAGNRGPWASAAEILLSFDASYIPPNPNTLGQWALTVDFPNVPVAAGVMFDTGGLLTWSASDLDGANSKNLPDGTTLTSLYEPNSGTVSKAIVTNTQHDMFCPGVNTDFKGQITVTGGNDAPRTSLFQVTNKAWISGSNMNIPRGYNAATTLSNGWTFTIGGSWSGGLAKKNGEVYDPTKNTWSVLSGADVTPMLTADVVGIYRQDNHGWLFAWKNQAVFQAGPSKAMNWYTTTGTGSVSSAGTRGDASDQMCGVAVMYDAVAGKIFSAGGSPNYQDTPSTTNTYIITLPATVGQTASVQKVSSMKFPRIFANGVVLPSGQIFVAGGQTVGKPFVDDGSVMYPELYTVSTDTWATMAPMSVPRNYHSIALLLPDATVVVGGGGLCDECDFDHYDGQIWQPPYLFTATGDLADRPFITRLSSSVVGLGNSITVFTSGPITAVSLIRFGTATHTVNTDQRRIPLTPVLSGANAYTITIPSDAGVALPGYWMLFVLNAAGVPSVAKTIQITL